MYMHEDRGNAISFETTASFSREKYLQLIKRYRNSDFSASSSYSKNGIIN